MISTLGNRVGYHSLKGSGKSESTAARSFSKSVDNQLALQSVLTIPAARLTVVINILNSVVIIQIPLFIPYYSGYPLAKYPRKSASLAHRVPGAQLLRGGLLPHVANTSSIILYCHLSLQRIQGSILCYLTLNNNIFHGKLINQTIAQTQVC